jgi:hypothetical protein
LHRAIHAEVAKPGRIVVVCPDFRCLIATPLKFGFAVPSRMYLVGAGDFAQGRRGRRACSSS